MSNEEAINIITLMMEEYKSRRVKGLFKENDDHMLQAIISVYHQCIIKPKFDIFVEEYKKNYIYNESRVESNIIMEEQIGLAHVYDYINQFDFSKNKFNIFVCSLFIHQKLYSQYSGKDFGGKLRDANVILHNVDMDVIPADEAVDYFNSFISNSDFIFEPLKNNDIVQYINTCITVTTDLIKAQPFLNGNKRTFRALLNLMLKKVHIPPIYVEEQERKEYKDALIKSMVEKDYTSITRFYHYKICDNIMRLDVKKSKVRENCELVGNRKIR